MHSPAVNHDPERVRAAFDEVFGRPPAQRDIALDDACRGDANLRRAVAHLLELHDRAHQERFLDRPLTLATLGDIHEPVDDAVSPPESIGRYRLTARLGSGSAGVVYLAVSPAPAAREVAIKVLRQGAPAGALERFRLEQQALASLDHPGIARIHDSGLTETGELFAVFEFVDGPPITTFVEQNRLNWRERVRLLLQACEAVQHAHQRGVLHRDLKPGNLLVTHSESGPIVKVIDFGVSKLLPPQPVTTSTEHGLLVGTLAYMAPEVIAGRGASDTRVDVYALGIILFELLEGRHPFHEQLHSLPGLIRAIGTQPCPAPTRTDTSSRRDMVAIIRKATHADSERRYASPKHLADDLVRLLAMRPVEASPPSVLDAAVKLMKRRSKTVAAVLACLTVIAALGLNVVASGREARIHRDTLQQTVGRLTDDVLSELAEMSGAGRPRVRLAELLDQRLEQLRVRGADSADIRLSHVRVLDVISDDHLDHRRFNEAEIVRRNVMAELESLLAERPGDRTLRRELARATVRVGDVLGERGDKDGALHWYEKSHEAIVGLAEEFPSDPRIQDDLCWSMERLAGQHWNHGRHAEAVGLADQRLEIALDLLARQPGNAVAIHNAAAAHCQRGQYARLVGDHALVVEHATRAAELTERLCSIEPTRVAFRVLDVVAWRLWARGLVSLGETEQARPIIETVRRRSAEVERLNPTHWSAARIARQVREEFPIHDP